MKKLLVSLFLPVLLQAADPIPNRLIDYRRFQQIARDVAPIREAHRLTEEAFAAMAAQPGTVVLDARSAGKYSLRHLQGAVSLPFTDFTAETLAAVIPEKTTRVLIYCNNNFLGAPLSLASKAAPASLNISTFVSLAAYGYTEVYELGPLLDVKTTTLRFEGTEVHATVPTLRRISVVVTATGEVLSGAEPYPDLLDCVGAH